MPKTSGNYVRKRKRPLPGEPGREDDLLSPLNRGAVTTPPTDTLKPKGSQSPNPRAIKRKRPLPGEPSRDYDSSITPRRVELAEPETTKSKPQPPEQTGRQNELPNFHKRADSTDLDGPPRKQRRSLSPRGTESQQARQRKRPTVAARISRDFREEAQRRHQERERERELNHAPRATGVQDFVRQHYNAVPERGKDFRNTESQIKGLRKYNNWVKAVVIRKGCPYESSPVAKVLDMGCGKGGDLGKWKSQNIACYVGLDSADVSVQQARARFESMRRQKGIFQAAFDVFDCFRQSIGKNPYVRQHGFDETLDMRWGEGGFDVVSMMFCMHYAWESEKMVRQMLKNVAGALKRGGRMIGVIPDSDMISARIVEHHNKKDGEAQELDFEDWDPEKPAGTVQEENKTSEEGEEGVEWGNEFYNVRFPGKTPKDGVFRPPYGNKYFFFLEESVEWVPEYVVPWGVFRGLAEDFGFSFSYKRTFQEIWQDNKDHPDNGPLADRMGVTEKIIDYDQGEVRRLKLSDAEWEASNFYCAFEFTKI